MRSAPTRPASTLHEAGIEPDWIIGTSIGAINASLMAGNSPQNRLTRLRELWKKMEQDPIWSFRDIFPDFNEKLSYWSTVTNGIPGVFRPNPLAHAGDSYPLGADNAGYYSTTPLEKTLTELVDFDLVNQCSPRLTVGAAHVRSSEMHYFDSRDTRLGVRHIMASGALPPAFPAIRIDGELYWDGGILSNTPTEAVFDDNPRKNSLIFAVHLWNPAGAEPTTMAEVLTRHKDVQYSSRIASPIARQQQAHRLRHVVNQLAARLELVRAFGDKVFDVIEATPDRLREVDGIGPVRATSILAAWAEQKAVREIMVFLHSHGVGTARAVRIFKTYGSDAIQVMTENPYRLARDIRGIGFKTADAIAMKLGIEKTATIRVRAGISYALTEAMDEGHCAVPLAEKLLEVPQQLIRAALDLELQEGTVIADQVGETPCVFLAGLHRAERTIADRLTRLANGTLPWPWIDPDKALPWVEKHIGLALAASQVAAVRLALGGFKRSSQHPGVGGCDEHSKAAVGSVWTSAIAVTGSAPCGGAR